jgi:predicted dehydrogenase
MTNATEAISNTAQPADARSRRQFLRDTTLGAAGAVAAAQFPFVLTSQAAPDDPIRIGLVGCGGRGTGAALDALGAPTNVVYPTSGYHTEDAAKDARPVATNVQVVALADVFQDRLERCREQLNRIGMPVKEDLCFTGFEAYQKVMALPEVNYVLLATPPFFRAAHLRAAVEAGKHAFVEKPVAVDATGVRSVIESGEIAKRKGLTLGAGTMRRRENGSRETMKRMHEGAIGELVACEAIWSSGELWSVDRQPGWSDMENQLRNWPYYTWLSGDFIVEQFVHDLDMINWGVGEHPVRAFGLGGRQVRTDPRFGNIYDHFAVEFEYANGVRCFALDRQTNGSDGRIEEVFLGSKGTARVGLFGGWAVQPKGGPMWRYREPNNNPYHQEHAEFVASIREGRALNEARQVAESTLTAIMARETAYSGKTIEWDEALNSKQDLSPEKLELGPMPTPPVAMPGQYRLS